MWSVLRSPGIPIPRDRGGGVRCSGWKGQEGWGVWKPTPTHRPEREARARERAGSNRRKSLCRKGLWNCATKPVRGLEGWAEAPGRWLDGPIQGNIMSDVTVGFRKSLQGMDLGSEPG